jgi:hypothetical protein
MPGSGIPAGRAAEITAFVEIEAPPPPGHPAAHLIFGTNQAEPAVLAADRHHDGLAPLIIATGGVNRGYTPGDWLARGSPTASPRVRVAQPGDGEREELFRRCGTEEPEYGKTSASIEGCVKS